MSDQPSGASDYNTKIIEEFRANQGRVDAEFLEGAPVILLHHIGARSGIERVTPVACSPQGEGRFAVWAANGGSPAHPAWYHNLKAHPRIIVEVGTQTFTVLAEELDGTARAQLWPKLVAQYPSLGKAQAKTTRQFPVFLLTPPGLTRDASRRLPGHRTAQPPPAAELAPGPAPGRERRNPPRNWQSSPPRRLNEPPTQTGDSRDHAVRPASDARQGASQL